MKNSVKIKLLLLSFLTVLISSCSIPQVELKDVDKNVPENFMDQKDSNNTAKINWKEFFTDPNLISLIDSALTNNKEINILLKEIEISRNEIMARKGEYLPSVNIAAGAGTEKVGRFTSQGANDANTQIEPGRDFPDPLSDLSIGAYASWELDVWRKLRNAKDASVKRYLSSVEGKNFAVTQLIAEIANSYYELMALDKQLEILKNNIQIQQNALVIVKTQKQAGKVTELAVKKFEAEVLKNRSLIYEIQQEITVTENRINFLVGRYPQRITRNTDQFDDLIPERIYVGLPSELLVNRPDIKQAELEIEASDLDIKSAKANFYPSFRITAGLGYQAYSPGVLFSTPESMLYNMAGDMIAPLINRNMIKTIYLNANANQQQAVYNYEQILINAFVEVSNQMSNISNLKNSYELKQQQVEALTSSINISTNLFKSARADYMEVMMTQRDALESKFEIIENKKKQLNSMVKLYRVLGGGWN